MVIEFSEKREGMLQKKLNRFEELKIGYFEQNLEDYEERELNDLGEWLKIHIS